MEAALISIVVPTYNRCEMLRDALESLVRQETGGQFTYEIVIVDNASTDATKSTIQEVAANSAVPVRYVFHEVPGDAPSRNRAVSETDSPWLAFFDDDQLAAPDWLAKLYQAAQEMGALVIGGAVQLHLDQDVLDRLGPYVRRTSLRESDYSKDICRFTGGASPGCGNALVARKVFDTVGTFDTSMIWGCSDIDFFRRVRAAGMDLYYSPHAVIRHRIPLNRLTPEYLRWDAGQGCSAFAGLDYKFKGPASAAMLCVARIAYALLAVLPRLAWGLIRKDSAEVLGQRVRLWRTEGYVRKTLAILAPALFPQKRYFDGLEFRKGRTVGPTDCADGDGHVNVLEMDCRGS